MALKLRGGPWPPRAPPHILCVELAGTFFSCPAEVVGAEDLLSGSKKWEAMSFSAHG